MSLAESKDYDLIKKSILERYGLNPLEYRNKFRNAKQQSGETFKEFSIRVSDYFYHWEESESVNQSHEKVVDMIVRDQLMSNCNYDLHTYLLEKEPKSVVELVSIANAYQLAHKGYDTRCLILQIYNVIMSQNFTC